MGSILTYGTRVVLNVVEQSCPGEATWLSTRPLPIVKSWMKRAWSGRPPVVEVKIEERNLTSEVVRGTKHAIRKQIRGRTGASKAHTNVNVKTETQKNNGGSGVYVVALTVQTRLPKGEVRGPRLR
jgi:hypothetical protein